MSPERKILIQRRSHEFCASNYDWNQISKQLEVEFGRLTMDEILMVNHIYGEDRLTKNPPKNVN